MRKIVRLTESDLHRIVEESVNRLLKESAGKKKLQNSFKSKEDMTKYRDMYQPGSTRSYVDYSGDVYDTEGFDYEDGDWGSGPYMDYSYHVFDDGYDYCGDDEYNSQVGNYNNKLSKRLATKGGQMSYDWEHRFDNDKYRNTLDRERERKWLEAHADERFLRDIHNNALGREYMNDWVNSKAEDEEANDSLEFKTKHFIPKLNKNDELGFYPTDVRGRYIHWQEKDNPNYDEDESHTQYKLDRKQAMKNAKKYYA